MLQMTNNDWGVGTRSSGNDSWDFVPQEMPEQKKNSDNINSGFQPEAQGVQKLRGPWYWPLTIVAFVIVGGLSFLMAYLTKDIPERGEWLMGLIFAVPMAAMFLASLLLEHRTCAMTPSYLRKSQCLIALAAVVATFGVGTLCDWIYLHGFVVPLKYQTVFVLDKSGSMSGDGNRQMIKAMERVIPSMDQREEVGLVLFDHSVLREKGIARLSENNHSAELLGMIKNTPTSGGTDFAVALNRALDLISARASNAPTQIIFLTDGGDSDFVSAVNNVKARCAAMNVVVHGVAFSYDGKLDVMEDLILTTGGQTVRANDMEQLVAVMAVLTTHDDDLLRSQDGEANLMTGIMLILEGLVIGLGMWLMLSVHGQLRVQMIISPLMGAAGLVLLKYVGFNAELDYWWIIEGAAFTLLGIVFMTKNRLLNQPQNQPKEQQNQPGQQSQPQPEVPDFDFF